MCVSECISHFQCLWRTEEVMESPELEFQVLMSSLMCVLRAELQPPARAASTLDS